MDIASPIAPAAPFSAAPSPSGSPEPFDAAPPWESKPAEPVRSPRKIRRHPSGFDMPRIVTQQVPWAVVALTLATAVLLVFGARAGGTPESRVMTFASADIVD
jgi:hypothetical protein